MSTDKNNSSDDSKESTYFGKIKTRYTVAIHEILDLSNSIEKRMLELENKERIMLELEKRIEENAAKAKQKIKLDIGGKTFTTSKTTLLAIPNTYFYSMISSGKWSPDEDGVYFIDRNPKHFDRILDLLRTSELNTEGLSSLEWKKLESDLDYYQIPIPKSLIPKLDWDKHFCGKYITISDRFVSRSSDSLINCWHGVLGNSSVSKFKLRLVCRGITMVGFASHNFNPNSYNYTNCGWYYHIDGTLYSQSGDSGDKEGGPSLQNGDIIFFIYNSTSHQISISVNNQLPKLIYSNVVSNSDLYPAIQIYDSSVMFELLSLSE